MKVLAFAVVLFASCAAIAQASGGGALPWQSSDAAAAPKPSDQVQFLDPAQVTVAAGKSSVIELHFRVADGLHINSHTPHESNLVPTQVAVVDTVGVKTRKIDFPAGTDTAFAFAPDDKLSVYTGEFVLKAQIVAAAGKHQWQSILRYQACNLTQCMPPRKLAVAVDVIAR